MKWNNWVRQLHRWVCIAFVLGVAAYMVAMRGGGQPPAWMGLLALVPLILLLVSGLYLFALPYTAKWRRRAA
jgi:cytochrome b